MGLLQTARNIARLGFYLALGAFAAVADACGDSSSPERDARDVPPPEGADDVAAGEDAAGTEDGGAEEVGDEAAGDAEMPEDGEDLWDVVFE